MAGHSVKISTETYAHVVLAASAAGQTISDWIERAAKQALKHQDYEVRVADFRQASIRAAERLEAAPLARDFGLASPLA